MTTRFRRAVAAGAVLSLVFAFASRVSASTTDWSAATIIDVGADLRSVSCAAVDFCVAVAGGNAVTFNGANWSTPTGIDVGGDLRSVSCPTAGFCVAVDTAGYAVIYNGASWSAPTNLDIATGPYGQVTASVSCPTVNFCMAMGGNGVVVIYNGASWSAPTNIVSPDNYAADGPLWAGVSCPTVSFCMTVDSDGVVFTFDGTSWSDPSVISGANYVSCATVDFCIALGAYGQVTADVAMYDGASWSPMLVDPILRRYLTSVSCATADFCMAVDNAGYTVMYDGTSWSRLKHIDPYYLRSVSCPTVGFCVTVNDNGEARIYNRLLPGQPSVASVTSALLKVSVAYTAPLPNGSIAIKGYRTDCVSSDGGGSRSSSFSLANPLVVSALSAGHIYTCTAVAKNAIGIGPPSEPSAPIVMPNVPSGPSIVSVTAAAAKLSVTYTASVDNGSSITGYRATCASSDGGGSRTSSFSLANPLVVSALSAGHIYTCTVVAKNAIGIGPPSEPSLPVVT